jgi:hypothetical protein
MRFSIFTIIIYFIIAVSWIGLQPCILSRCTQQNGASHCIISRCRFECLIRLLDKISEILQPRGIGSVGMCRLLISNSLNKFFALFNNYIIA